MSLLPKFIIAAVISACLVTVSNADNHISAIPAGVYDNDPSHTSVHFTISHLGFSHFVGRFNFTQATLTIDPNNLSKTTLSAIIDIGSLDANSHTSKIPSWDKTSSTPNGTQPLPSTAHSYTLPAIPPLSYSVIYRSKASLIPSKWMSNSSVTAPILLSTLYHRIPRLNYHPTLPVGRLRLIARYRR